MFWSEAAARSLRVPLALAALLAICACQEAGQHRTEDLYGEATRANFAAQDAYNSSNQRLVDLGRDFARNTQPVVNFAFDKAVLDPTARAALDSQAMWLTANPDVRMTIVGHTDLVGSERYNSGLGLRRAQVALNYLVRSGVARSRLEALASRGELDPLVQTDARERRNRRTVTTVAGFARNYVGTGLEGEYAHGVYNTYQAGGFGVTVGGADPN
ncbi:MAG: OmpA family protein [Pseudomonadota bacterium]